jgi:hypothetical protein
MSPPGHARYAFDLVGVDPDSGRIATRRAWELLAGLARAGSHLHIQVQRQADPVGADVIPFRLTQFEERMGGRWIRRTGAALPARRIRVRFAS